MQADMMLEKQLRVLHLDLHTAGRERERDTLGLGLVSQGSQASLVCALH